MNEKDMNESTKPWYQSTTIISSITTGIIAIAASFKLEIGDLQSEIFNLLSALAVVIGTVITIYGRIKASKSISIKNNQLNSGSSTNLLILSILIIPAIIFVGCSGGASGNGSSGESTESAVARTLPYIRPSVSLVCSTVLNLAVSNSDRTQKANYIYAVAKAVRTLSGGNVPTVGEVSDVISLWAPEKTHWANLASSISAIYAGVYSQIQGDAKLAVEILEAIAGGCEDAAAAITGEGNV